MHNYIMWINTSDTLCFLAQLLIVDADTSVHMHSGDHVLVGNSLAVQILSSVIQILRYIGAMKYLLNGTYRRIKARNQLIL